MRRIGVQAAIAVFILFLGPAWAMASPEWKRYASVEEAGWSAEKLAEAERLAQEYGSAAVMVIDRGAVVAAWGETDVRTKSYSIRKSMLGALYGPYVESGAINLQTTLGELGIDDLTPLSRQEKSATIGQLLSSTSGVYHPAAKEPPALSDRPVRNSTAPGEYWWYNNWSFNVLATIFEQLSGDSLADAAIKKIALPVGLEDLRAEDIYYEFDPQKSLYPAYEFEISARDLARFGVLIEQHGRWRDRQVIPEAWVETMLSQQWSFGESAGYGYMWWINPSRSPQFSTGDDESALDLTPHVAAIGSFGQVVLIAPEKDIVIVHRGDRNSNGGVDDYRTFLILEAVMAAKVSQGEQNPRLVKAQFSPPRRDDRTPVDERLLPVPLDEAKRLVGEYAFAPGRTMSVYLWREMLFISGPRPEDSHLQLLKRADGAFSSRTLPLIVSFETPEGRKAPTAFTLQMGPQTIRALRVD